MTADEMDAVLWLENWMVQLAGYDGNRATAKEQLLKAGMSTRLILDDNGAEKLLLFHRGQLVDEFPMLH